VAGPPLAAPGAAGLPSLPALPGRADAPALRSRVRLRSTRHIRMLGVIMILMAIAAINYQSNAAWALVMGLIAVLGVSILHTRRNLLLVQVLACRCAPVFAQEPAEMVVELTATGMPAADITVTLLAPGGATGATGHAAQVASEHPEEVACRIPGRARGVTRSVRVRLGTTYPLGLFTASWEMDLPLLSVVYPAVRGSQVINAEAVSQLNAGTSSSATTDQAGTDDFSGHRRFSEGDPRTLIDWKAHARGGPLLIKRFTGAATSVVWCEWEATHGPREERLSQLAAWLVAAEDQGLRYGLRLPGREVAPDQGAAHRHACLLLLAEEPA